MKDKIAVLLIVLAAVYAQNCTNPLRVGTFNTELILTAPFRQERAQAQVQFFQSNQANLDILCLQEIWDPTFRQQFTSSLQSTFPYSFYPANFPLNNTQCSSFCAEGSLNSLSTCLSGGGCLGNNNNQVSCAINNCRNVFNNIDNRCAACLSSSLGLRFNDRIDQCSNPGVSASQCLRFFNGYTDNLILSKYPLLSTDYLLFSNSPLTETTVLYARVNTSSLGPVNVFCTHLLPANFQVVDFSAVNTAQTQQMLSWVQSKVNTTEPVLLMGDFNFGPLRSNNIDASWPQNYELVVNSGFTSAYINANPNPQCTYCRDNPLNTGTNNYIIDHIFVKNAVVVNSTRFATERSLQAGGTQITLSDHFGVAASICPGTTLPTPPPQGGVTNTTSGAVIFVPTTVVTAGASIFVFSCALFAILSLLAL